MVALWARRRREFPVGVESGVATGVAILAALVVATGFAVLQKPLEAQVELLDYGSFSRAAVGHYHGGTSLGVGNLLANVAGGLLLEVLFASTRNTWTGAIPHAALVAVLLALA